MSDDKPNPTSEKSDASAMDAASGGGSGRKVLLLILLIAVIGLFAYDQLVTKSDFNAVKTEVEEMPQLDGLKKKGDHDDDGFITPGDVKFATAREPVRSEDLGDTYLVETYSWSRIIPGMKYNLYVVYRKGEERNSMYRVTTERPSEENLPQAPEVGAPGSVPNPVIGGLPQERPPGNDGKDENESGESEGSSSEDDKDSGDDEKE